MSNPLLSIPQKNLLRHLADNAQGITCEKRQEKTLRVLAALGLAEPPLGVRHGRPTKAGLALVKAWGSGSV